MSLKLVSLFPDHLDLNGDQANLKIIQKRLQWFGYQSSLVAVNKGNQIPLDADLIFLGHGSMAAWTDINEDLVNMAPEIKIRISSGTAFMAVSTGHERAIQLGLFPGTVSTRERVSKFEIAQLEGKEILGYLNSASDAPVIQKHGLSIGTQLHGPVFAKNPNLVDTYLAEIMQARNIELPQVSKDATTVGAHLVDAIVEQVWELERELASE
jgi:CobQ-like glutamine amidotransferase family enzyme